MTRTLTTPHEWLDAGLGAGASDWQLCAGQPVAQRVNGCMSFGPDALDAGALARFLAEAAPKDRPNHYDGAFAYAGERFRLTTFAALDGLCATIRHIPTKPRPLASLGLPPSLTQQLTTSRGLWVVTGPTGSGKSATLASIVDHVNQTMPGVIITLEHPIEYLHPSAKCVVRQRGLHEHFSTFAEGVTAALRQDPDVLLIGEMRDPDTFAAALTAAETGHLTLATMHTGSAAGAVSRILDAAHADDAAQQRAILAKSLRGVIAQRLVPTVDGGRTGVFEVLLNTLAVENCIRNGSWQHIPDEIARGARLGMQAFDAHLENLVSQRRISRDVARANARDPQVLAGKLPRL